MMETKLDIFEVLKNIDKKNFKFLENLEEDKRNMFVPFVVFQWLQSSNDASQIVVLNKLINNNIFKLQEHPDLVYKLCCISSNKFQKYSWIFKKSNDDESVNIISEYFKISKRIAKDYKKLYTNEDVKEMAKALGYQNTEIQKLKL